MEIGEAYIRGSFRCGVKMGLNWDISEYDLGLQFVAVLLFGDDRRSLVGTPRVYCLQGTFAQLGLEWVRQRGEERWAFLMRNGKAFS